MKKTKSVLFFMLFCFFLIIGCTGTGQNEQETSEEKDNIKRENNDKIIRIAGIETEPYCGEHIIRYGYISELVEKIFTDTGYTVEFSFYPLKRAIELGKRGQVHIVLPLYEDAGLSDDLLFSDPLPGGQPGLIKKKNDPIFFTGDPAGNPGGVFEELKEYRFGIVDGTRIIPELDEAGFLKKDFTTSNLLNLTKLLKGRTDLVVIDKYVAAHLMLSKAPQMIGKLEFINPPFGKKTFYLAFSKQKDNCREIAALFNERLAQFKKEGTLNAILSSHGLYDLMEKKEHGDDKITIVIGSVDNNDMIIMKKLSEEYKNVNPHIEFEWRIMDENILRDRLLGDLAISEGTFDVMTIGGYEAPIWAQNNWLVRLQNFSPGYDVHDLLPPIRNNLSYKNNLYALPFYGESSMLYYRKDLFEKAGITMPENPTWAHVKEFAAKLHDPDNSVYGICLRGKPGWGEMLGFLSTLVNSNGGKWFDEKWNPQLDSKEWRDAVLFYEGLVKNYGPPEVYKYGFSESLVLFAQGRAAMWVDATVAAGTLFNPKTSKVHDKVGFAQAPGMTRDEGKSWLWTWSLAIPSSSKHQTEAFKFIQWATSKEYIIRVGETEGWVAVPPGTRISTYKNPNYREAAEFASFVLAQILASDASPRPGKPYQGIQYVGIPEFPAIGSKISIELERMLKGEITVEKALANGQEIIRSQMIESGYIK